MPIKVSFNGSYLMPVIISLVKPKFGVVPVTSPTHLFYLSTVFVVAVIIWLGKINGSGIVEELRGHHALLRDCIEQLTSVESTRANLVSHLREVLQDQVSHQALSCI